MHASIRRLARRWLLGKDGSGTRSESGGEQAPALSDDPLFEQFVDENYQGGDAEVSNPNPDTRERFPTITFQTAMKGEAFRRQVSQEFERWKGSQDREAPPERARSEEEKSRSRRSPAHGWGSRSDQDAVLDVARHGKMVDQERIAKESRNVTRKRTLKLGEHERDFIWKPAFGEDVELRGGIEPGTYHRREAATYNIDRLLGDDVVVPPTMSTGKGSYQAWSDGAQMLGQGGAALKHLSNEDLKKSPSFRRIVLLDALIGNEDRHANNIMYRWKGDESDPKNLHFDAIDNGLVLASPENKKTPDDYVVRMPWAYLTDDPKGSGGMDRMRAVSDVLSEIDPELHDQLRGIKLEDFVRASTSTGIKDEKTLMAAAVRLVALQEDAFALGEIIRDNQGNPRKGVAAFLHLSGSDPKRLLQYARAEHRLPEIEKTVREAM